mmetsp:Transcript_18229/g.45124  ORF Transcript_18229/g.45124 Transcript_18229/m.45124 type:complete len:241 (+) Transcript_18229:1613-2335(+)
MSGHIGYPHTRSFVGSHRVSQSIRTSLMGIRDCRSCLPKGFPLNKALIHTLIKRLIQDSNGSFHTKCVLQWKRTQIWRCRRNGKTIKTLLRTNQDSKILLDSRRFSSPKSIQVGSPNILQDLLVLRVSRHWISLVDVLKMTLIALERNHEHVASSCLDESIVFLVRQRDTIIIQRFTDHKRLIPSWSITILTVRALARGIRTSSVQIVSAKDPTFDGHSFVAKRIATVVDPCHPTACFVH